MYTVFEMTAEEWTAMESEEQSEVARTLADDIFYGLGAEPELAIGCGTISYDKERHILTVRDESSLVTVVHLT